MRTRAILAAAAGAAVLAGCSDDQFTSPTLRPGASGANGLAVLHTATDYLQIFALAGLCYAVISMPATWATVFFEKRLARHT